MPLRTVAYRRLVVASIRTGTCSVAQSVRKAKYLIPSALGIINGQSAVIRAAHDLSSVLRKSLANHSPTRNRVFQNRHLRHDRQHHVIRLAESPRAEKRAGKTREERRDDLLHSLTGPEESIWTLLTWNVNHDYNQNDTRQEQRNPHNITKGERDVVV